MLSFSDMDWGGRTVTQQPTTPTTEVQLDYKELYKKAMRQVKKLQEENENYKIALLKLSLKLE